jgi:hypothetical protein
MEKSTLLSLSFLLFFSLSTWAQTQKGSKLLGGSVSGFLQRNNSFSISLSPQIGYFVINNLALGTGVTLSYFKSSFDDNTTGVSYRSRTTKAGISPFVRYYFGKSASTRLFTHASVDLWRSWSNSSISRRELQIDVNNYSTLRAGVGVVHFITNQVGLEALLSYTPSKNSTNERNGSLAISVGLQFYLPVSEH